MAHPKIYLHPIAEAWVLSPAIPRDTCNLNIGVESGFSNSISLFPSQHHSTFFWWSHSRCVCINWDKGDPSNTTQLYSICYYMFLLRQHISTFSRGHHQAVDEVRLMIL
jgi:hypothetical protein